MLLNGSNGGRRLTLAEDSVLENGLYLIGTGVGSALNMGIGGQRIAAACEHRFLEGYTSLLDTDENIRLETIVGTYSVIRRPAVEVPDNLLGLAKTSSVALMVIGDPLQATTHVDLLLRCRDEQIHAEVHHAVSVVDLVCAGIGLQSYKFGRQVTIPFPYSGHVPTSPLELIADNFELGLHTLVLLDLDPTGKGVDEPLPMSPRQAIEAIHKMVEQLDDDPPPHLLEEEEYTPQMQLRKAGLSNLIGDGIGEVMGVMCSNMGRREQEVNLGTLNELRELDIDGIHSLVILGPLSGLEEEALKRLH